MPHSAAEHPFHSLSELQVYAVHCPGSTAALHRHCSSGARRAGSSPAFCWRAVGRQRLAGLWVVLCVLQAAPGGPEPLNPRAVGLGEGARGWWDVSVEQESPEEFVCFPCTSEQRVSLSLAALWLRPGGAGLQQRAAALPQARHGDGTSRACPAVRELRSCCCFEQSVLRSPGCRAGFRA